MRPAVILKIFLFLALFWGVERFCHKQTRGFQMHKILSTHEERDFPDVPFEEHQFLDQPYYFLGSGGQCYAFVSEDQRVVLKVFKNHHIRFWKLIDRLSLPSWLDGYRQKFLRKNLHQSPAFFESCKISYLEFKERTGLIYLHLCRTDHLKKKLTIVDKLGIAHQIDLDSIDFALQKKAEPTNPKLKKLIRGGDLEAAKECIESILGLVVERCHKGIRDRDPNFRRNMGFIGNQAIEIDLGSYLKDDSLKTPEGFKKELLNKTQKFEKWLQRRSPTLSLYLSERIAQVLEENAKNN